MGLWPFWQPVLILYSFLTFMYKYFGKNKDACLLAVAALTRSIIKQAENLHGDI